MSLNNDCLGNKLALMKGLSTIDHAFAALPGGGTVVYTGGTSPFYYRHAEWLGSSRFSSTPSRTMHTDLAFAPFGEQYAVSGGVGVEGASFAGNPEDTNNNLYDAQFREYGIQGRWPSPDPAGVAAANPANPQSWNRYAYALNNPLLLIDPFGMDPCYCGTPCGSKQICVDPPEYTGPDGGCDPSISTNCASGGGSVASGLGGGSGPSGGGGGGGGNTPTIGPYTPPNVHPACDALGIIFDSLEFSLKFGIGVEVGQVGADFAFSKDLSTGVTTGEGGLGVGLIHVGAETQNSINADESDTHVSVGSLDFNHDLTTGITKFEPSASVVLGIGVGVKFNSDTFKALKQQRCGQ